MTDLFDWVPFYEELAPKLAQYRLKQQDLISILANSGVNGLADQSPEGVQVPLTEIDPFTFLALINKQSAGERKKILQKIKQLMGIRASVPEHYHGIPKADARQAWLFPYKFERGPNDVEKLWDLYDAVMSGKGISANVFDAAYKVKYAGHAKLTQAIFRAAPTRFFPVDRQTVGYLAGLRLPNTFTSVQEFEAICKQVAKRVHKPLYAQSYDAWLLNQKKDPSAEIQYQNKVLQKAVAGVQVVEPKGGVAVPRIKGAGLVSTGFQRNPNVAASALVKANFACEIDPKHKTFTSNAKGKPYVEAHHLIPFSNQGSYAVSLDVMANIVALCPNCHRLLHHGVQDEKSAHIAELLSKRDAALAEKELKISKAELLRLYNAELLEDNA